MIDQHALLEALFFIFKDNAKQASENCQRALSDLLWETRKHFFVEEEAIFNFLAWNDPLISDIIKELKEEHVQMINSLAKMGYALAETSDKDMESFYNLLKSHRETEEKDLYPVLDKCLTEGQKEQVIARINQVVIKK